MTTMSLTKCKINAPAKVPAAEGIANIKPNFKLICFFLQARIAPIKEGKNRAKSTVAAAISAGIEKMRIKEGTKNTPPPKRAITPIIAIINAIIPIIDNSTRENVITALQFY